MTEQELLEAEPTAVPTDSKWTAGISPDQPVCEVAGRVLDARLKAVCQSLPLAAEKSDEDVEHVHQLRISVRRAVEAVRVFSGADRRGRGRCFAGSVAANPPRRRRSSQLGRDG